MPVAGDIVANLTTNTKGWTSGFGRARSDFGQFTSFAVKAAGTVAAAFSFSKIIGSASGVEETMNKFNVVFGRNAEVVKAWSDSYARQVGRAKNTIADFLASSQDLFVPLGFDSSAAEGMSKTVTQLAVDLASFNNKQDGDVLRDLHAALTGGGETVKKYGVILNVAAVNQELLNQGMDPRFATEQQKAMARLNIIMGATTAAQGDALRSAGSFANQWKRLKGVGEDLAASLGARVLPLVTSGVEALNAAVAVFTPWLDRLAALLSIVNGNGGQVASMLIGSVTALVAVVGAYKLLTIATQAWANAQRLALALSGPKGWAVLAAGVTIAAVTSQAVSAEMERVKTEASAAATSADDLSSSIQSQSKSFKTAQAPIQSYMATVQKLQSLSASFRPTLIATRIELNGLTKEWKAASAAGAEGLLPWDDFDRLRKALVADRSGFTSVFNTVSDDLRMLRDDINETELGFRKMLEAGADPKQVQKLREMFSERERLQEKRDAAEKYQEDRKALRQERQAKLKDTRDEVLNSFRTPADDFRDKAKDVQAAVAAGLLSGDKATAFLDKLAQEQRDKLSGSSKDQATNSAVRLDSDAANQQLVNLLNRRAGTPDEQQLAELQKLNTTLSDVKFEIKTQQLLKSKPFGG